MAIFKALSSNKQIEYFSASVCERVHSPGLIKKLSNILSTNYNLQICRLHTELNNQREIKFKKIMKRNKAAQIRHRFKKTKLAAQWVNKMNHFQLLNRFDLYLTKKNCHYHFYWAQSVICSWTLGNHVARELQMGHYWDRDVGKTRYSKL